MVHQPSQTCTVLISTADTPMIRLPSSVTWMLFELVERSNLMLWPVRVDPADDHVIYTFGMGIRGQTQQVVEIDFNMTTGTSHARGEAGEPLLTTGDRTCRNHEVAMTLARRP